MLERAWNLDGYVLVKSSAERDVEDLRTPADGQYGLPKLACRSNQSDLRSVPPDVGWLALCNPGLSVERRFYIFAPGQEQSVDPGKYRKGGSVSGERWDDDWYKPCILEGRDVGAVEPDTMRPAEGGVGGGGDRDNGRFTGVSEGPGAAYTLRECG